MGVYGANALFKSKDLFANQKLIALASVLEMITHRGESVSEICVDFMGSFFGVLMGRYRKKTNGLHSMLHFIKTNFPPDMMVTVSGKEQPLQEVLVFVFDGARTKEKLQTAVSRMKSKTKSMQKDYNFLQSDVKPGKKISGKTWQRVNRAQRNTWSFSSEDNVKLQKALSDAGYRVVMAAGEADVYIANKDSVLAISSDSDLFMHEKVRWCARLYLEGRTCCWYKVMSRSEVLRKLEVVNAVWVALAIVSGNDYSKNVSQYGIKRNFTLLKNMYSNQSIEELVKDYLMEVDPDHKIADFSSAIQIFTKRTETLIDASQCQDYVDAYDEQEEMRKLVFEEITRITKQNEEWKKDGKETRRTVKDLMKSKVNIKGWKKRGYNPFQPLALFNSDDAVERKLPATPPELKGRKRVHGLSGGRYVSYQIETSYKSPNIPPKKPKSKTSKFEKVDEKEKEKEKEQKTKAPMTSKVATAASSRKDRDMDDCDEPGKKRNQSHELKSMRFLKKNKAYVTMEIGDLKNNISKGSMQFKEFCTETIRHAAEDVNKIVHVAELLVGLFLQDVMEKDDYIKDNEKSLIRLVKGKKQGNGGRLFWCSLLNFVRKGTVADDNTTEEDQEGEPKGDPALLLFKDWLSKTGITLNRKELSLHFKENVALSKLLQLAATEIDKDFGNQIVGNLPVLKEKVRSSLQGNVNIEESQNVIVESDVKIVSTAKRKLVGEAKSVKRPRNELNHAQRTRDENDVPDDDIESPVARDNDANDATTKKDSKKTIQFSSTVRNDIDKYKNSQDVTNLLDTIGKLESELTQFHILNQLLPKEERFQYPLTSVSDGFVQFTEDALINLLWSVMDKHGYSGTQAEKVSSDQETTSNERDADSSQPAKKETKGAKGQGTKRKRGSGTTSQSTRDQALARTQALAYFKDFKNKMHKPEQPKGIILRDLFGIKMSRYKSVILLDILKEEDMEDETEEEKNKNQKKDEKKKEGAEEEENSGQQNQDNSQESDADKKVKALIGDYDKKILLNTFITNGKIVKIHMLDCSRKAQKYPKKSQEQSEDSENATLDIKRISDVIGDNIKFNLDNTWIVGLDLGVIFAVAATAQKGWGKDRIVRQVSIKSNALGEPQRRYRNFLRAEKLQSDKSDQLDHEAKSTVESTDDYYELERNLERNKEESPKDYFARYLPLYKKLSKFYNSKKMKKKNWDYRKARRAELDRATHAILKMVDCGIHEKMKAGKEVVFVLGNAEFETKKTTHMSFEKHFVRKIRSLGYPVIFVDERFTSQRCPCCQDVNSTVEGFGMRVKYCRSCSKWFHRDSMAAENMVQIGREQIIHGSKSRPKYLERTPPRVQNSQNDL